MEPMMINAGAIEPAPGYLEGVRALCDRHRAVLVFDEIITGFRIALGGAVERYRVVPDLATSDAASSWNGSGRVRSSMPARSTRT
jgi:glutamate-1-semialdehyde 2,1-aminomutase